MIPLVIWLLFVIPHTPPRQQTEALCEHPVANVTRGSLAYRLLRQGR